ncbi:uncharacterized protein EAE98_000755 [Botrytis deweyae]|uniref:Copper transporter n=1 Tax=Botrytis deweyae TaxID=2478750 RepID=A0ABQ7IZT0_9HELO|nr:uncharacterized protein EAE98_000755 [Botrytis deweyae]KAF7938417.1 hypothetical protein EAE98_000755 [Botrytis deweyae]
MLQNITRLGPVDFEHLNLPLWLCAFIDGAGPHTHKLLESGCKDVTWMYQTYAGWISLAMVIIYFSGSFFALLVMIGILLNVTEGLGQKLNVRKDMMTSGDTSVEEKGQISAVWLREDSEDEIREKSHVKFMVNEFRSTARIQSVYKGIDVQCLQSSYIQERRVEEKTGIDDTPQFFTNINDIRRLKVAGVGEFKAFYKDMEVAQGVQGLATSLKDSTL